MYRQYEDPHKLEQELAEARERLAESCDAYGEMDIDLLLEVQELEDRVNFAWQDNEYESNYAAETWMDDPIYW